MASPQSPLPAGNVTLPVDGGSPPLGLMALNSRGQGISQKFSFLFVFQSYASPIGARRTIGGVADPKLVGTARDNVLRQVREDRAVMVTVCRGEETSPDLRLQLVFVHEATNLLVVHDKTLLPKRRTDAAVAVELEPVADRERRFDNGGVVGPPFRAVIIGGARDSDQPVSFRDGDAAGPVMTDIVPFFSRGALFRAPFRNSSSRACLPTSRSSAAIRASYSWMRSAACASSSNAPCSYV